MYLLDTNVFMHLANKASKRGRDELAAMFNADRVLPFTGKAAEYGGLLLTVQREKGKAIEWPDTMRRMSRLVRPMPVHEN